MLKCLNGCCLLVVKVIELTKCVCLVKISTGIVQSGTSKCLVGGSWTGWYYTHPGVKDWDRGEFHWPVATHGRSDQTLLGWGTSMNLNVHKESLESFYLVHLNISASQYLLWGAVDKKLCNTKYFTMVHASNIFDWEFSQLFAHCAAFLSDSFCEAQLPFEWLP